MNKTAVNGEKSAFNQEFEIKSGINNTAMEQRVDDTNDEGMVTVQEPKILNRRQQQRQSLIESATKYYRDMPSKTSIVNITAQKREILANKLRTSPAGAEMPNIHLKKNIEGKTQEISSLYQEKRDNSQERDHSSGDKKKKHQLVGLPYKVKTMLPFYDGRGVYTGSKINAGLSSVEMKKKLQTNESAYQTQQVSSINSNKKSRTIGQ